MSPTILDIFDRVTVLENYASLLSSYEIAVSNTHLTLPTKLEV